MYRDRMDIYRKIGEETPDYGSLYLIRRGDNKVNEYGGTNEEDSEKLELITNAADGSTCLFVNGSLYRKELDGWNKMGGE